jgi:phosphoribosyl-AMP cyclohydrolase
MDDLQHMTLRKRKELESMQIKVISISECEFDKMIKENAEMKEFVDKLDVPQRMKIRDSFFGGRTSGFKLHYKCRNNEEIGYLDICSLYPFINKTAKLPIGHPEIISSNFDYTMENYFGIAHIKVLPPCNLYIPVLPVRIRGKLMFPLCYTCAHGQNNESCHHSDDKRCFTGVWCTPEIQEAMKAGYKILKIYEVYHYPDSTQFDPETCTGGLFSEQVNLFLKIKTEASGYPEYVETDDQKEEYIHEVEEKTGIRLEKDKIEKNPALRSISKICCNSFWGKLAERQNKPKSKYVSTTQELAEIANDSTLELTNFHIINEDMMVIEYINAESFEKDSRTTNVLLASFTTSWARLELLKHMQFVDTNLLYCDTDSIIFVTKKNEDNTYENFPNVGSCLGELTNELKDGQFIEEFVCTGPKSYSYRTNDGQEIVKFKGISLNFKNSERVNFESVKELVFGATECISLTPQNQFKRLKYDGIIYNADLVKKVKQTFDKRRITDNFNTLPFGFK